MDTSAFVPADAAARLLQQVNPNPGVFDDSGTRVMELGLGTFIVLICGILGVLICIAGVATPSPKLFIFIAVMFVAIVAVFLGLLPRKAAGETDQTPPITQTFTIGSGFMVFTQVLGLILAGLLFVMVEVGNFVQATPVQT